MRVIEPKKQPIRTVYKKRSSWKLAVIALCIIGLAAVAYRFFANKQPTQVSSDSPVATKTTQQPAKQTVKKTGTFKEFTGQQFKDLYYSIAYPNTQQVSEPFSITGNIDADIRIRTLAEARGYKQTVVPQAAIVKINEPRLNGDNLLQPLAASGWESLKSSAKADQVPLSIISAYRSPEWQKDLFMQRLTANGAVVSQIAGGGQDIAINTTLGMTAVPGYSRHHTGYTIDLWCEDGSGSFKASSCYEWIKKDNYLNAKKSGWIPSYPEGTDLQGPEPEPWEFVWVGTDVLTQ